MFRSILLFPPVFQHMHTPVPNQLAFHSECLVLRGAERLMLRLSTCSINEDQSRIQGSIGKWLLVNYQPLLDPCCGQLHEAQETRREVMTMFLQWLFECCREGTASEAHSKSKEVGGRSTALPLSLLLACLQEMQREFLGEDPKQGNPQMNKSILPLIKGPGRTHNRIRSPRFLEFGRWSKVGNRSRQNRSRDLFCRLLFPSSLHRPNSRNLGGNPLLWEKDWLWGLGTGVLVLMFELSRSYLTSLVESGFLHGTDCWTWNVFRDAPCGANSHLRTGEDGGFSCWQSPRCLHPLHLNGSQHIMRCDLGATGWHPWGRRVDWRMQSMKPEIFVGTPLTKKLDEQRIECETVSFCLTDFSAKRLKAFVAAKVTPCNSLIVASLESTCLIQKNVNHFIWWICLMFVRD